ncbi:MAG: DegV family protein [Mycoplasmoidaceae bacterium]|nr:MAG: DegV family protein [Mycoplasmoidaceae bacterium]
MKKSCIVFDSGSNFSNGQYPDLYVLPLQVIESQETKEVSYSDGIEITIDEMEKQMVDGVLFKTSASNPNDAITLFEKLSAEYEEIYVFLLPYTLSPGQNNSINLIAEDFPKVKVIPHYMVSLPTQWEAQELLALNKAGKLTIETATAVVNKYRDKLAMAVVVPDLSFLARGGRISKTKGFFGKLLHITALVSFDREGVVFRDKAMTSNKLYKQIDQYFKMILKDFDYSKIDKIGILHSNTTTRNFNRQKYEEEFTENIFPKIDKKIVSNSSAQAVPCAILAHLGPNYYALIVLLK